MVKGVLGGKRSLGWKGVERVGSVGEQRLGLMGREVVARARATADSIVGAV